VVSQTPPVAACPAPECGPECCPPAQCCHTWANVEYLLWAIKTDRLRAPLLTTGTVESEGVVGRPGTTVLFGDSLLDYHGFHGGRFHAGVCDPCGRIGAEVGGFILEDKSVRFAALSDPNGLPVLARPFVDVRTGVQERLLVAFPGALFGNASATASSRLWGLEANGIGNLVNLGWFTLDALAGFRYLDLTEQLGVTTQSTLTGSFAGFGNELLVPPDQLTVQDQFNTRNQVYVFQAGTQAEFRFCGCFVALTGKLGVGWNHESVDIAGTSTATRAGESLGTLPGGLLALQGNSGRSTRNDGVAVPEFGVTLGYTFCGCVRAYVGYNIVFVSSVVRPGDQLNALVDPLQIPTNLAFSPQATEERPVGPFERSDFFAHGLFLGAEFRY
jgi:hypothetical protein